MSIDTSSRHITQTGGNVFADLGFEPGEAAALQREAKRIIKEKLAARELQGPVERPVGSEKQQPKK